MSTSALVVGAGINGLLVALELARRGCSVRVIDQGEIPNQFSASHGKHRLLHPWKSDPSRGLDAHAALELWDKLLRELECDGFSRTGVIVANTDAESYEQSIRYSPSSVVLSYEDTCRLMPQLAGGQFMNAILYPEFGCLFADRILYSVCDYLSKLGVVLMPRCEVSRIEADSGRVELLDGRRMYADLVFISAGTGTHKIRGALDGLSGTIKATTMRCYVMYLDPNAAGTEFGPFSWASLGGGDLWGMPNVRGIAPKLGCGQLTTPHDPDEPSEDLDAISRRIIREYSKLYPQFSALTGRVRFNHWTLFSTPDSFHIRDKAIIMTACSGIGYKFAPLTAQKVCTAVLDSKQRAHS
ncbi:FAD-dependent oxidoreductase [Bradyrhizobium sp. SSUT77]|uniref:FAD-dependent oxidoreductase n=1 Tax=Bradyrhizobium sp. SSUT77 TaxID=3040603 RepID=UPI002449ECE5|nr:FAD-dependent oxidoreductase [Bradyrhizobium sp. SSUT77]MDH2343601.1 FAD-dependent oxidoreductase [Bradyrhizobium sp. SSUT77]